MIVLACVGVCALVFALRHGSRKIWSASIINIAVLTVLTFLPEALWVAFVRLKTGSFYQHEIVAHGEVVWMLDAWNQGLGTLVSIWLSKLASLLRMAAPQSIPLVAALMATLVISKWRNKRDAQPALLPLAATVALVSAMSDAFYTCVGFMVDRIAFSIVPPLIIAAAGSALAVTEGDYTRRRILAYCCVAIALVAAIYTVAKNGPYS